VAIGRPHSYGLAVAGETGVRNVLRNRLVELDVTPGLAGCTSLHGVDRDVLHTV
jgi:lactate 2-monooxygenase